MYGIRFKNKHSFKDFGITIKSREINPPSKNKVKETIPFMHGSYDFSDLYGEQTYQERTLIYVFNIIGKSKVETNTIKQIVEDWLLVSYKTKLEDDDIPGYYFFAECEDVSFSGKALFGELTATFTAYPFKYGGFMEGNLEWDSFNFLTDYMQDTKLTITGSKAIEIYSPSSRSTSPEIVCSGPLEVVKEGVTYGFITGSSNDYRFKLKPGKNDMVVNGTGTIEFKFRKEVL